MVQASIDNERYFDRVADALIIQHRRIHLRACRKRAKGKGKDGIKRGDNSNTRWLQEKGKHTGSENMEQVLIAQTSLPLKITILMTTRSGKQMLIKPTMAQSIPEALTEKKLPITMTTRKTTRFAHMLLWMTSLFSRQLNWMQLLFLPTRGTTILTQKLAHSWCERMYKLTFPSERRKGRARGKARAKANFLFVHHVCPSGIVDKD